MVLNEATTSHSNANLVWLLLLLFQSVSLHFPKSLSSPIGMSLLPLTPPSSLRSVTGRHHHHSPREGRGHLCRTETCGTSAGGEGRLGTQLFSPFLLLLSLPLSVITRTVSLMCPGELGHRAGPDLEHGLKKPGM